MRINKPINDVEVTYKDSSNILSTTDLRGKITYVNDSFVRVSGFEAEEVVGKSHNIVRHPDMPPAVFESLWNTIKSGRSWMGVIKNRCKNGDYYWADAYVSPIVKGGVIIEYQSVRIKPKPQYVKRAKALYQDMMAGKKTTALKRWTITLQQKIWLAIAASLSPLLLLLLLLDVTSAVLVFSSVLLGLTFIGVIVQWLLALLKKTIAQEKSVFEDPIARYVYGGRQDEIGLLSLIIRSLHFKSISIVGRISDSSQKLSKISGRLTGSVDLSDQSVVEQHAETDQVATAINQMTASIQTVANNAHLTSEAAKTARREAEAGKAVVEQSTDMIKELAAKVGKATAVVQKLEDDSKNISSVLDVITSIAEQTNLLALNAAIEAARAGEQGRGFAVVADEVRTLANRTHESTREIQEIIEDLQKAADQAVKAMQEGRKQTEKNVSQATTAVDSLDAITESVKKIDDMSAQIATAVNEQKSVTEEVNRSISTIRDLSELTVENADNSKKSGAAINKESNSLRQLSDQFWLKEQGHSS